MATIETHHVTQFSSNVERLLTFGGYRLRPLVKTGMHTGTGASPTDQIGRIGGIWDRGRNTDTPSLEVNGYRRWVIPHRFTTATHIDDIDKVRMLIDPKGSYAAEMADTIGRAVDDRIGEAFFAPAYTGQNFSTTTTSFPSEQTVGTDVGGTNTGLNVPKLIAAMKLLRRGGLDLSREKVYMAVSSNELANLFAETQVTSTDYNDRPVLVNGQLSQFMGVNFVHVEWQATDDSGNALYPLSLPYIAPSGLAASVRNIPMWVESGMHLGVWREFTARSDQRPDKNYIEQLWAETEIGATRLQEKKVVKVTVTSAL